MWDGLTAWCKVVQTTEAATDTVDRGAGGQVLRYFDNIPLPVSSVSSLREGQCPGIITCHKTGDQTKYIESRKTCAHDLNFSRHLNSLCSQLGWHRLNSIAGNSQESEGYGEVKTVRCSLLNRSAAIIKFLHITAIVIKAWKMKYLQLETWHSTDRK